VTFRDPIIYPGEPERPRIWTTQRQRVCVVTLHHIKPGTQVQLVEPGCVACLPHVADWESQQKQEGTAA
jgi:hypothetical protein